MTVQLPKELEFSMRTFGLHVLQSEWNFHVDTEGFTITLHWKKADHVIKECSENSPVLFANRRKSIRKRERDKRRLADYLERKRIKDSAGKRKGDIKVSYQEPAYDRRDLNFEPVHFKSNSFIDQEQSKTDITYSTTMETPNVLKQVIAPPCYREMVEKRPMVNVESVIDSSNSSEKDSACDDMEKGNGVIECNDLNFDSIVDLSPSWNLKQVCISSNLFRTTPNTRTALPSVATLHMDRDATVDDCVREYSKTVLGTMAYVNDISVQFCPFQDSWPLDMWDVDRRFQIGNLPSLTPDPVVYLTFKWNS